MRNPPVNWHEGLFLRPHHFQAADRYWDERISSSHLWDFPYRYGVAEIELSQEALANHHFQVGSLRARLRDGTLVSLDQQLDRIDLKGAFVDEGAASADLSEAFESERRVTVFVGIPKLRLGRQNTGAADNPTSATRYSRSAQSIPDEAEGGNEQEIQFRNPNIRLLLSTDETSGFEVLPIARVKRSGAAEARPQLDDSFIPPLLAIDAWPGLGRDIVRAIYDLIGEKIHVLSEQIRNRGIGLDSQIPGDADRILMLSQLNAAYTTLGVMAFARGVHPFTAYVELCRIAGQLSIFSAERRAEEVPPYDHEDLARIFHTIKIRIEALINAVQDYEYEQRYFVGVGLGMQVTLEPKWFSSHWQWYIGVNKGELTQTEARELLSLGHLDWKFGSSRQVEILFSQRAEGLQLLPVERVPRAMPSRPEWVFYEISRNGQAWRDVQETQTLAMRLKDSLIVNKDDLQGERRIIVSAGGTNAALEFALFALPTQR